MKTPTAKCLLYIMENHQKAVAHINTYRAALTNPSIIENSTEDFKFIGFNRNTDESFTSIPYTPNGSIVLFNHDKSKIKYFKLPQITTNYQNHNFYSAGSFAYFLSLTDTPYIDMYYDLLNNVFWY